MEKSELSALPKAIIAVMKEIKGIEKSMTVGSGNNSYKGVSDQDVKNIIGAAMEKNGLCILPIGIEPTIQIDRWEEPDQYSKIPRATKQKQSVFTTVKTKYLLMHESGESMEISGYGHGTDSQDKAAGKATTYALKYALLYTFMVPTGKIDDADSVHSDDAIIPRRVEEVIYDKKLYTRVKVDKEEKIKKPLISNLQYKQLMERIRSGDTEVYHKAKEKFTFESTQERNLEEEFNNISNNLKTA